MLEETISAHQAVEIINRTIEAVMAERGLDIAAMAADAKLVDTLGLKSMDIAQIVLTLEDDLEVDPFQKIPITSIRTVGDLITAYVVTLDPSQAVETAGPDDAGNVATARSRRPGRRR